MFTQTAIPNPKSPAGDVARAIPFMPRDLVALVKQVIAAHPGRAAEVWEAGRLILEGFATPDPAGTAVTVAGDGRSRVVTFVDRGWLCPCGDHSAGPCIHELAAALTVDETPARLVTPPGAGRMVAARTPPGV